MVDLVQETRGEPDMNTHHNVNEGGARETARIEAFSDGVFAIAITLLILELISVIHIKSEDDFLHLLLHHWQALLSFIIGFLTILICWINHHLVFTYIRKTDSNLFWVNGFVLLVVTFTPFPTAMLAEYFSKETNHALAFFGLNYFMMSLAAYCITAYTYNRKLITEGSMKLYHSFKKLYAYSVSYTLVVFIICFFSVPVAVALYCLMFLVFAFPKEFATRLFMKSH